MRSAELGANWGRSFGPVELDLVALQRLERDQNFGAAISDTSTQIFNSTSNTGESILRATARYVPQKDLMIESGLEGAYNFLNGRSSFISNSAPIALPGANPKVNEKRGEAITQASWRLCPGMGGGSGARFEFSTIAARAFLPAASTSSSPGLLVSWSPVAGTQIRVRAERVVGQLDFNNFIASSNFSSNGINAGNLMLRPGPALAIRRRFRISLLGQGRLVFSYTRENITDLVDYIPIGGGLDGPGNIPKATNNIYDLEMSMPLDRLGGEGTTLQARHGMERRGRA